MKVLLACVVLMGLHAPPAHCQSASARMAASASVTAPVRVDAAVVAISRSGAGIDVTRPLGVDGPGPWVLEVVAGAATDPGAQRLAARRSNHPAGSAADTAPEAVAIRLPAETSPTDQRMLTYVVATVN